MPAGRPPEYDPKICDDLIEYFDHPITIQNVDGKRVIQEPRTLEHFLFEKRIPRSTFYKWKLSYPELVDTIDMVQAKQVHNAMAGSMMGYYNHTISKLLITNISDYRDKQEHDHKSSDGSMKPVYHFNEKEKK